MPKVMFKGADGLTFEADLTLDQIKELAKGGHNGNGNGSAPAPGHVSTQRGAPLSHKKNAGKGVWSDFINDLSPRSHKFISVVRKHPTGIDAMEMASILGFQHPSQLGGVTGPGLSKIAEKHGINISDIYRSEIGFPGGVRKRLFFPGNLALDNKEENPL